MLRIATAFLIGQLALLGAAHMPGVAEPARGALLLSSLSCFGGYVGSLLAARAVRGKAV